MGVCEGGCRSSHLFLRPRAGPRGRAYTKGTDPSVLVLRNNDFRRGGLQMKQASARPSVAGPQMNAYPGGMMVAPRVGFQKPWVKHNLYTVAQKASLGPLSLLCLTLTCWPHWPLYFSFNGHKVLSSSSLRPFQSHPVWSAFLLFLGSLFLASCLMLALKALLPGWCVGLALVVLLCCFCAYLPSE